MKWPTFQAWFEMQRKYHRHRLEKEIARTLLTMDGHESMGVPRGDARYISLRDHVNRSIQTFCMKWSADEADVRLQIPGLVHLDEMCVPTPMQLATESKTFWVASSVAVLCFLIAVVPILLGVANRLYHLVAGR